MDICINCHWADNGHWCYLTENEHIFDLDYTELFPALIMSLPIHSLIQR